MSTHGNTRPGVGVAEHDEWRARIMRALEELRREEEANARCADPADPTANESADD